MRLKFGSTIFDAAGTSSTVLGTAMTGLRLFMDSNPFAVGEPDEFVMVSESEDATVFRFFLVLTASNAANLTAHVALVVRAVTDPPGTEVVLESVSGTTLRSWSQASQDYLAATGECNVRYADSTTACFECVVSLTKTPFKGTGAESLGLEGRLGPHVAQIAVDQFGLQTITLSAAFAPLANGTDARTNATSWVAAVTARTASNLSWLPNAANLRTVSSSVEGQQDYESKTLGTAEAVVVLRQIPPALSAIDSTLKGFASRVQLIPRRLGYREGSTPNPGYDAIVEGVIEHTVASGTSSALPTDAALQTAAAAIVSATLARAAGSGTFLCLSYSREHSGAEGRFTFVATGVYGTDTEALGIMSYAETVSETEDSSFDVVPDWEGGDVVYQSSTIDRRIVTHEVSITARGNVPPYEPPRLISSAGGRFIRQSFTPTRINPDKFTDPSEGLSSLSNYGEMNAVNYRAVYVEVKTSASGSSGRGTGLTVIGG